METKEQRKAFSHNVTNVSLRKKTQHRPYQSYENRFPHFFFSVKLFVTWEAFTYIFSIIFSTLSDTACQYCGLCIQ